MTTTSIAAKESSFRFLDIHVSEIDNYSNAIEDLLFNHSLVGMIIRDVFPHDVMEQVVERLEKNQDDLKVFTSFYMEKAPHIIGPAVPNFKPENIKEYFAATSAFRQVCRSLFPENYQFEERVRSVFHALSGGRPVEVPTGLQEEVYNSATIRLLPDGHEFIPHAGNVINLNLIHHEHLLSLVNIKDQLSYFIPLSLSEAGGELIVYNKLCETEEVERYKNIDLKAYFTSDQINFDQYEHKVVAPSVGDMVLFQGGRYYHRVSPASGSCPRRTIGGLVNGSYDSETIYYWI
jgi:hypothetical protein